MARESRQHGRALSAGNHTCPERAWHRRTLATRTLWRRMPGISKISKICQVPNADEMIWSCKHGEAPHVQSSWVLHPFVRACQPQRVGNIWETSLHFWQASGMTHTLFGYIWSPVFPCLSPHLITSTSCRNLSNLGFLATTFAPRRSSVTSNMASSNLT